jgi:poly-gamma-glutamate synthesis protein (capsule biosynthesis protein)
MLDELNKYNIPYIGAGHNLEEASMPYFYIINGYKIALLNGTRAEKYILTPAATDDEPGVFRCYDTTNMVNKIKEVREESDFVITIMHFGKESSHNLETEQINSAKEYIDAGSDIIIGHHAHVLQGIEFYNGKPIIYNLGNFIFNAETVDTAIFQILLDKSGKMEYKMIPAIQKNKYTDLLYDDQKQRLINDFNSWSINARMDEDGMIFEE